jgi:hypothetical protein
MEFVCFVCCIHFVLCVLYCVYSFVCCVLFERGVLFRDMCVVIPLPPGKNPFTV